MKNLSASFIEGRADKAVELQLIQKQIRQSKFQLKSMMSSQEKEVSLIGKDQLVGMVENLDDFIYGIDKRGEDAMTSAIGKWKNDQYRHEGLMRKASITVSQRPPQVETWL